MNVFKWIGIRGTKEITAVIAVANKPDLSGNTFTKEALETIANGTPNMWMEGDKLMGRFEVDENGNPAT